MILKTEKIRKVEFDHVCLYVWALKFVDLGRLMANPIDSGIWEKFIIDQKILHRLEQLQKGSLNLVILFRTEE